MKRLFRLHLIAAVAIACITVTGVVAQSEKVNLRIAPASDQTVRMTMAQDMDMDLTFEGASPLPGLTGPMKMVMRMTMDVTQKIGARKPDGTVDAETTYDQVQTEMSLNGQALPAPTSSALTDLKVTATYNQKGELVDVKGIPDSGLATADLFKQMMSSFYGNLPEGPIAIGETATTPLNFSLPLPLPGGAPLKMVGETKTKLISIDREASGGRSARLESVTDGKMVGDIPSPDKKGNARFDFLLKGGGTTVMDLTKGVLRSSITSITMDGRVETGNVAPVAVPPMRLHVAMTVTMASN